MGMDNVSPLGHLNNSWNRGKKNLPSPRLDDVFPPSRSCDARNIFQYTFERHPKEISRPNSRFQQLQKKQTLDFILLNSNFEDNNYPNNLERELLHKFS